MVLHLACATRHLRNKQQATRKIIWLLLLHRGICSLCYGVKIVSLVSANLRPPTSYSMLLLYQCHPLRLHLHREHLTHSMSPPLLELTSPFIGCRMPPVLLYFSRSTCRTRSSSSSLSSSSSSSSSSFVVCCPRLSVVGCRLSVVVVLVLVLVLVLVVLVCRLSSSSSFVVRRSSSSSSSSSSSLVVGRRRRRRRRRSSFVVRRSLFVVCHRRCWWRGRGVER